VLKQILPLEVHNSNMKIYGDKKLFLSTHIIKKHHSCPLPNGVPQLQAVFFWSFFSHRLKRFWND